MLWLLLDELQAPIVRIGRWRISRATSPPYRTRGTPRWGSRAHLAGMSKIGAGGRELTGAVEAVAAVVGSLLERHEGAAAAFTVDASGVLQRASASPRPPPRP